MHTEVDMPRPIFSLDNVRVLYESAAIRVAMADPLVNLDPVVKNELLYPSELQRIYGKARASDQCLSATGLILARKLLGADAVVIHGQDGRPHFNDGLVSLSISHTDRAVVVALGAAPLSVGVDVECVGAMNNHKLFSAFALHPIERKTLQDLSDLWHTNEEQATLILWSLKESFFKTQVAKVKRFSHICILPEGRRLTIELTHPDRDIEKFTCEDFAVRLTDNHVVTALAFKKKVPASFCRSVAP